MSSYSVQAALQKRVFCSGRRGDFGFFADGGGAAHEFGTTQDSIGACRGRRLGEIVYQLRRRALEHETAAALDHGRRAGRARSQGLRTGRRVHDFDGFEACALDEFETCALLAGWNTFEFRSYRLVLSAVVPQRSVMRRKLSDTHFQRICNLENEASAASDGAWLALPQ